MVLLNRLDDHNFGEVHGQWRFFTIASPIGEQKVRSYWGYMVRDLFASRIRGDSDRPVPRIWST